MPIIQSAKKKMRKDKKLQLRNNKVRAKIKTLARNARRGKSEKLLPAVASALDKAVKIKLIHKNKAARLKSRLAKLSSTPKSKKG